MFLFPGEGSQFFVIFLRCALCSTALVIPSCEGIGLDRACAVRHQGYPYVAGAFFWLLSIA